MPGGSTEVVGPACLPLEADVSKVMTHGGNIIELWGISTGTGWSPPVKIYNFFHSVNDADTEITVVYTIQTNHQLLVHPQ